MKNLIKANEIYQDILKVDEEINSLENDIKNVIKNDLNVAFEYTIKNKVEERVLDEDGSLIGDGASQFIELYGKKYPVYMSCAGSTDSDKETYESSDKKLDPSEFVIMFAALLNYKKQLRNGLVKEFKSLNLKLKL